MITVSVAYTVVVFGGLAVLLAAGWRRRHASRRDSVKHLSQTIYFATTPTRAQVLQSVETALKRVHPLMAQFDVRINVAVMPVLVANVRNDVLSDVIEDMLTVAIRSAPACRLLLTAVAQDDEVEVTVTDDLPNANHAYRLGQVKGLQERVVRLGGTLHLTAHSTEGATLSVRLAASTPPSDTSFAPYGHFWSRGVVDAPG